MKKLALLLLSGLTTQANAQQNTLDIGIEGGPGITTIHQYKNQYLKPHATLGYSGGFFVQYNFPKIVSIRTGMAFERKGFAFKGDAINQTGDVIGSYKASYNFDYITMPVLLRATIGNKVKFFANVGPYFAYLLNQEVISKVDDDVVFREKQTGSYKPFDLGLSTGLGMGVPIGNRLQCSFEVRNNLGLINITESQALGASAIRTNSTNFLFGLAYKLGSRL